MLASASSAPVGGSGVGEQIAANKIPSIRAALACRPRPKPPSRRPHHAQSPHEHQHSFTYATTLGFFYWVDSGLRVD